MKAGPISPDAIRARARDLGVRAPADASVKEVAAELGVTVDDVKAALFPSGFHSGASKRDLVPRTDKGAGGMGALALLSVSKAMASAKKWDPIARLPERLQARLSPGDRRAIEEAVAALQQQVRTAKLDHVPVFGYLSLRTHNCAELGKRSQADVVAGRDVIAAHLPGFDVDLLVSTMFRGTPEHPGAVAGLSQKPGASTPGSVLKLPLDRAEELLAVVLAREMFAEGDLVDGRDQHCAVSNALYAPKVLRVVLEDGREVPALVFATNDKGDKAIAAKADPYGDGQTLGLTVERMAYLFAAQGGFVDATGNAHGGPAVEYWEHCYLSARKAAGQPIDAKIAAAVELSKLMPQQDAVDRITARTDREGRLMAEALRLLFTGVAVPLATKQHQKPELDGLVRTPQGDRGDVEQRLLARARELEREGKISLS